ncbi:MAG: AraC family transcriptional regulator [Bacteroidota bacterium]
MNTAVMNKEAHGLDEEKLEMIKASISQFIKSELFLERDMTLAKLAKSIETNTSYLSKVINSYYGSTFTNFMNELRISYTLKSLEAVPEFREFTIDHIAERSGFASSSAFYKAFKKHTGLTPSYYIKKRLHQHAQSV